MSNWTEARLVTPQCLRWDSGDEWHKIEEDTFRLRRRGKGIKTPVEFVTLPRNGFVVVPSESNEKLVGLEDDPLLVEVA